MADVTADYTPASALSLQDLRRDLLQRAAAAAAQARTHRRSGRVHAAHTLSRRAEQLVRVARSIDVG